MTTAAKPKETAEGRLAFEATRFEARLTVETDAPGDRLDKIAENLADYVPAARLAGEPLRLDLYGARGVIEAQGEYMIARVTSPDRGALANMKYLVAWNLREVVGNEVRIAWSGDDGGHLDLPQFREMRVVAVSQVAPAMRRVRLTGENLSRFAEGGLHVHLLIPPADRVPVWPQAQSSGIPSWPEGEDRLTARVYTIRRIDPEAGFLDVDIVLHEGDSPGSDWARNAKPGDPVGMMGPGGGGLIEADRMLFAGDETALPAIARMLEELAPQSKGTAIIEIADASHRQDLVRPEGVDVVWLERGGAPAGTTTLLQDAVAELQWPEARRDAGDNSGRTRPLSVWIGCEFQAFKQLRHLCRKVWGLKTRDHLVVAYWRRAH